jgi:hypothetical protein
MIDISPLRVAFHYTESVGIPVDPAEIMRGLVVPRTVLGLERFLFALAHGTRSGRLVEDAFSQTR